MIKEIKLKEGTHSFIFVGIEPYDYLDRVIKIFESNFEFANKNQVSGWHSTALEYTLQDFIIIIGDEYDVLSITLVKPITEVSLEKVRELVQTIDNLLSEEII
jgi:hypothetical protein